MKSGTNPGESAHACLAYFGKMAASATHELKNAIAIINENAGLLDDLVAFSQNSDTPLAGERVRRVSQALKKQVSRADHTLRKLNQFSHTADREFETVDIEKTAHLVVSTASRLLDMKDISIRISGHGAPVLVHTRLFVFETLLWRAIETASTGLGTDKTLLIEIKGLPSPSIWFKISHPVKDLFFNSETDIRLMEDLNVTLNQDDDKNRFGFIWPDQT